MSGEDFVTFGNELFSVPSYQTVFKAPLLGTVTASALERSAQRVGGVTYFWTFVYSLFIMMMMMMVTAGVFCQFDSNNYGVFGIVFT